MLRQTVRTFFEVRDGVVKIVHTDPVLTPIMEKRIREGGGKVAQDSVRGRPKEDVQNP